MAPASAADDVMIVYDASGSMWAQVDGENKIVIAREVMADLLDTWPQDTKLGLIAYGHRPGFRTGLFAKLQVFQHVGEVGGFGR
ncbi:MAG: hypothetical protein L0H54_11425 [Alcaligenaceae bacterium]|nr:hypothetical protein [Alcaligenaceae bacterium]